MVETLKYASVSIEEVFAAKLRFEANVFNVEALKAKEVLKNCKWEIKKVCGANGLALAYHRERFKRIYIEKSNYPIFQPSQILELYPKPYKYISDLTNTDIEALRVSKGQILMTCSGTIGKCTIVNNSFDRQIFSHDLLRINVKDKEDIGFVYAYLISETGQSLITTNNYGAVIKHIEPEHLEEVHVPYPSKPIRLKIHNLVIQSFDLRDQANELIDQAERLLINELKLPPVENLLPDLYDKNSEVRTFSVRLDLLNNRFDGSYHNPVVSSILDCLFDEGATIKRLDDINVSKKIIQAGRFKRNYVESDHGTIFLGGKQILELDPTPKKYLSTHLHSKRVDKDLFIEENMIAITRSGTIGKTQIIPEHWNKWAMSEHVLRVVPKLKDIAGYLYIWLQSDYGKVLIERLTYGAVVDEIEVEHLAEVPIPILKNENAQQQINDLALNANKLRAEAYYKEQEAIKIFNDEVLYC